MAFSVVYQVWL